MKHQIQLVSFWCLDNLFMGSRFCLLRIIVVSRIFVLFLVTFQLLFAKSLVFFSFLFKIRLTYKTRQFKKFLQAKQTFLFVCKQPHTKFKSFQGWQFSKTNWLQKKKKSLQKNWETTFFSPTFVDFSKNKTQKSFVVWPKILFI